MPDIPEDSVWYSWLSWVILNDSVLHPLIGNNYYTEMAPEGTIGTRIVAHDQTLGGIAVLGAGADTLWMEFLTNIRAICEGMSFAPINPVAGRLYSLLHKSRGTAPGGQILGVIRVNTYQMGESPDNQPYRQKGGFYRSKVQLNAGITTFSYEKIP